MKPLLILLILLKATNAVMKGFPKAIRSHMNWFLQATTVGWTIFHLLFSTFCSCPWKHVDLTVISTRKPFFYDRISDFQNPFKQIGVEFDNNSSFWEINKAKQ